MSGFQIGGLATGLDTSAIVDQFMKIESRGLTRLDWTKQLWQSRKNAWTDLSTKLLSLDGYADALTNPTSWSAFAGLNISDGTKLAAATVSDKPAAGSYDININQLAQTEVWTSANALAAPTAGVRVSGTFYAAGPVAANGATLLTALRRADNVACGLNTNSTITMNWAQDGESYSSTFVVGAASTLNNLRAWAQTTIPGSTVTLAAGQFTITSPTGTTAEVTSLNFTARNAAGTALAAFDGHTGAQTNRTVAASDGGAGADTLIITQGANTWFVPTVAGDDEIDLVNKINGTAGIGVKASLNAGKLELTANDAGAGGSFTVASTGALAATLGIAESTAGQDAAFDVNGTAYTRSKNTSIDDVISGISLDLLALTGGTPVNLTVGTPGVSVADLKDKITSFVNQYNEIIDYISSKTGEKRVTQPKTLAEFLQGPMSTDHGFSSVSGSLRLRMNDIVSSLGGALDALSDIGITTGGLTGSTSTDSQKGKLVIDDAKLEEALTNNRTQVQDLFTKNGGGAWQADGIARRVSNFVFGLRSGGTVDSSLQGAGSQITSIQRSIDRMNLKLERRRTYYERMFSQLEGTIGKMQSQGSWLASQLSGSGSGFGG